MRYTKGRFFTHNIYGTFEIPDDVDCVELRSDKFSGSTRTYTGTLQYRKMMASEADIALMFKKNYFTGSSEYQYAREFEFAQERFISQKVMNFRYYGCSIRDFKPDLTSQVVTKLSALTGESLVKSLGTHVIDYVEFGGFIKVYASVSSAVLSKLTSSNVDTEVDLAFARVATGVQYVSSCDIINSFAHFDKEIGGGRKDVLMTAASTSIDPDFAIKEWKKTIFSAPTWTKRSLKKIEDLIDDDENLSESIELYENDSDEFDEILIGQDNNSTSFEVYTCVSLKKDSIKTNGGTKLPKLLFHIVLAFALSFLSM